MTWSVTLECATGLEPGETCLEDISWCTTIQCSVKRHNIEAENNEMSRKEEKKHPRKQRLIYSETALNCILSRCSFNALLKAGPTNHRCQSLSTITRIQSQYYHHTFIQQRIYDHQCFYSTIHLTSRGFAITNVFTQPYP